MYTIQELSSIITPIARKHGVRRVSVFGSVARGEAVSSSDVDLLIDAGSARTLFELGGLYADLDEKLACPVDVVSTGCGDQAFLTRIRKDEVVLYEQ